MKSAGKIEQKNDKGMMVPLVLALIFLLAMIVWPLNNYMRHERNLVARMRYSAITDKMAISAVNEACAWFNCCVLNLNALLDAPVSSLSRAEKSVLAPVIETDIEGLRGVLGEKELHSFDIIKESGGRLNSVEFYYSGFKNYFKDTPSSDYENSCYIPADPFERTGGLMISASVSYRGITRVFTTRYEIKITNTLPPVVSAFTFFTKSRNPLSSENSLVMEGASSPSRWHLGPQGIIYENASASSFLAVPLIMVHHPDDIAVIDGYCPNHEKIREYLPPDPSVTPATANFYRPSMDGRGWVYFGAEPTQAYVFNLSPGNANPQAVKPYPDTQKHKFYGNGFLMLESDLIAPVNSSLKGCYPFSHSFTAVNTPSGISDYVIRIINSGIYWIARSKNFPLKSYMLGNYYALRPKTNDFSSVLQISGDLQPVMFMGTGKPSRYLDRRSPTIVFGKAFRSFLQIGSVAQNCVHLPGSKGFDFMNAGLHKYPFEACPDGPHPKTVNLPYFEINRNSGLLGTNAYMPFTHPAWHEHRIVDDFNGTTAVGVGGFAKAVYDIRDDVFGCGASPDADKLATYGIFMSKVITENYNRSNDWIFANSQPKGGVIMPSDKYALKKNFVRSLGSTAAQEDEDFFYNKGGCYHANNLEIYQLDDKGERSFDIFKKGLFKGNLRAVKLHADEYSNPMALEPSQQALSEYDIRQKAGYIFNDFEDFKKYFTAKGPAGPSILNITEGGVYYFDSPAETDLTQSGQIKEIIFHQNTMLIFKSGVKLPKISKSPAAFENKCTMSIISMEGNLTISGSQIAASLCALKGSILKNTDYFQVFGNMVMGGIDFDLSKNGNLFRAAGASPSMVPVLSSVNSGKTIEGFNRVCVIYDPALNPCDIKNYRRHYKYHIASKKTYWKVAND